MLDLEYLNRFGKDLVSETDRLLQVKSAYEEINPEVLYKAELTEDGRNIRYTAFENVPGLKDIATDTSDFIKSQIGKYLEDKSSNLRECITAMVMLNMCTHIYMLKGWEKSPGANREYGYALASDMIIMREL